MDAMQGLILILAVGIVIGIVVLIRVLAGKDHAVGRVCRWFWNTSFKFAAFIPFMGWMTRFMIGEEREIWIAIGDNTDQIAGAYVQEEARIQRRQEAVRQKMLSEGYTNVSVSSDGYSATGVDRNGVPCDITVRE